MRYRNTKTGAESDNFSEADWKSGQPQRNGWVKTEGERPVKTLPKDIIDFVFKKKPVEFLPEKVETGILSLDGIVHKHLNPAEFKEPDMMPNVLKEKFAEAGTKAGEKVKKVKPLKVKQNDNPKQKRTAAKRKP